MSKSAAATRAGNVAPTSKLSQDLAEGIASGRYAVGSLLPTEFELCASHGLSRYAVRKALDELQDLGLISRRKNVGTRVEAARPRPGFTQSIATVDELAQFGAEHVRVVRDVREVVADLALARELACAGGARWLRISSLRTSSALRVDKPRAAASEAARPICWTDVYLDAAYADIATLVRESPGTLISSLVETRYGRAIARIQQEVHGLCLSKELAAELQAEPGAAALKIVRRYLDAADQVFEISVTVHPADRFIFSMEMTRARA